MIYFCSPTPKITIPFRTNIEPSFKVVTTAYRKAVLRESRRASAAAGAGVGDGAGRARGAGYGVSPAHS